jgi:hypothetical protein
MRAFAVRFAATAALLALVGCKPEMEISLAGIDEHLPSPRFTVEEVARRGERPRYTTVQVLDEDGTVLWHLRAEPFGDLNSVASLVYGTAPTGFVEVVKAAQLSADKTHAIVVSGPALGQLKFRADSTGLVRAED